MSECMLNDSTEMKCFILILIFSKNVLTIAGAFVLHVAFLKLVFVSVTLQQDPDILVEFSLYTSYKVFHLHSCNLDHQGGRCIDVCAFLSLT